MRYVELGLTLVTDVWLAVLAADLLYLYHAGAWREPIRVILLAELTWLTAIIPFAIWRFIVHLRRFTHETTQTKD